MCPLVEKPPAKYLIVHSSFHFVPASDGSMHFSVRDPSILFSSQQHWVFYKMHKTISFGIHSFISLLDWMTLSLLFTSVPTKFYKAALKKNKKKKKIIFVANVHKIHSPFRWILPIWTSCRHIFLRRFLAVFNWKLSKQMLYQVNRDWSFHFLLKGVLGPMYNIYSWALHEMD